MISPILKAMFILRKFTGNGVELNFWLGDGYTIVYKEFSPKEFKELENDGHTVDKETCFAVISCDHGKKFLPLFGNQQNQLLTSDGRVFEQLD